jgi:hypothetical protein
MDSAGRLTDVRPVVQELVDTALVEWPGLSRRAFLLVKGADTAQSGSRIFNGLAGCDAAPALALKGPLLAQRDNSLPHAFSEAVDEGIGLHFRRHLQEVDFARLLGARDKWPGSYRKPCYQLPPPHSILPPDRIRGSPSYSSPNRRDEDRP